MSHVVLVPSALALLPEYAGLEDPVADLREACRAAVSWLVARHPDGVRVVAAGLRPEDAARGVTRPAGERVGRHLLAEAGCLPAPDGARGALVVANGSATRSEKAPGHLDERAARFDAVIERALDAGDPTPLRSLDPALAEELWVRDVTAWRALAELMDGDVTTELTYADDPYGVQYWVARLTCER